MAMVGGLDLHRRQITFDAVEVESGEEWRGRIWQPDRGRFRRWLRGEVARRANGEVALAVEGCTGWRYVVEEITAAGFEARAGQRRRLVLGQSSRASDHGRHVRSQPVPRFQVAALDPNIRP